VVIHFQTIAPLGYGDGLYNPQEPAMARTFLFFALALIAAGSASAELSAGAAKRSIVPPFPTQMGGYYNRLDTFTGVSRPVLARALVLKNGDSGVAIMVADLIAVSKFVVDGAREKVAAATGLKPENILISATHSHSAPSGFKGSGLLGPSEDTRLTDFLIGEFAATIVEAHAALRPATLGFAYGRLDGATVNRQQNNDSVIDPDLGVLKVQEKDTRNTIATLANFTGHPVILGGENLLLSCEYPGVACEIVENVVGGVALFTQGACGDVTMKRSGPEFDEVTRIGRVVAGEIIATSEQIKPGAEADLRCYWQPVTVQPRKLPTPEEADAAVAAAEASHRAAVDSGKPEYIVKDLSREISASTTTATVARAAVEKPESLKAATQASVHVLQIGPLVVVGVPGEMFVEYALEMKRRVAQDLKRPMILVGYANDYIGYIITPRADATGGYEKAISRVAPTAGRTLTEAAMAAAREMIPAAAQATEK